MPEPSTPAHDTVGGGTAKLTPGAATNGSVLAVAIGVMNIATYGFTIVAARALGPQQYGAFAAVMNLLIVVSVASLALQATAARRIASTPGDVREIEDGVRRVTLRAALGLGGVLVLAAPLLNVALRLESLLTAALVGLVAVPLTVMGGQAGILQGERRWKPLALLYVAAGVPRLVLGTGLILWQPEELVATFAVFIGALAPVAVGWWALRERGHVRHDRTDVDHGGRAIVRESIRNSQALLAFFAVSNIDIIVARNVLDDHDSGLYAGGLILTKAMLFLPQFVVVLAFPDMADSAARRRALRLSLGVVGILGVVGVAASYLLSQVALVFVGGDDYVDVQDRLWLFAVLGTLLSMIQLLVYALLAQESGRLVALPWAALAVIGVAAATLADSVSSLLAVVVAVDAVLFVALLLPAMLRAPADASPPD
ncbi:lipopolysaccharide biosynthesis protein [Nocardioides sp.]|uniref:lipopolysaccharide biosynthesis protein n=1 Tax=Nocardioides sp. TaxID=35761 RepID=UPI0027243D06|nr:lipopolysaccharide biosynthesis protein [Nocardioides sp.]MDO9455310.1 lipopolysaccharide biosynthesis protein [Nocardioides sp.]